MKSSSSGSNINHLEHCNDDDIRNRKQTFRKQIRAAMKELSPDEVMTQSQKVWDRIISLPAYQSAKSVGVFLSMPKGEIQTDPILQHAVSDGKDVYVPQVGTNFEDCHMELRKVVLPGNENDSTSSPEEIFHKSWPRNKWQIPEPPKEMAIITAQRGDLDLLIVPGLGFDRNCNRLGQGKGYYDRFIERMTVGGVQLPLVAVCLSPQIAEHDIPVDVYDRRMDIVVFPDGIIKPDESN